MNAPLRLLREMTDPIAIIVADAHAGVVIAQTQAGWSPASPVYRHEDERSRVNDAAEYVRAVVAFQEAQELALDLAEEFVSKWHGVDKAEMEAGDA